MVKERESNTGKETARNRLVIVESPAKARTIRKFLGDGYVVEASIGHIRDLAEGRKQVPEKYKKEKWSYLGVNVESNFEPVYVVPPDKTEQVRKLKRLCKEADEVFLATDEDREGEAISWHLLEVLQPTVPVKRLVFHEITRRAIEAALANPREIDDNLVRAQETRRIVDRLYGFDVSPLLWRKLGKQARSAGRVQSVAVRFVVEREVDRMAFVSATYWDLVAVLRTAEGTAFQAGLVSVDGKKLPSSKDFDSSTGRVSDPDLLLLDEAAARALLARLGNESYTVEKLEEKPYTSKPGAPFTTSTLQQEANRKFRFSPRRTMDAAQSLYENGHITYMRTDSTNLAEEAIQTIRQVVSERFGDAYLADQVRLFQTKVRNAQEAHEAIRPAGTAFPHPGNLAGKLTPDELKIYDLIWKRTIACQMSNSRGRNITIEIRGGPARFAVGGRTIDFEGFLKVYSKKEDSSVKGESKESEDSVLPSVDQGAALGLVSLDSKCHTTQPPARFTEASLIRTLEEKGIGRPSTYASIIDVIQSRNYVFKKNNALVPTWPAFAVSRLLVGQLPDLVDYSFTARMEDDLDAISRGEAHHIDYLRGFYFGDGTNGLKERIEKSLETADVREIARIPLRDPRLGIDTPSDICVRVGRHGPFIEWGERRSSIPDDLPPDELTVEKAKEMVELAAQGDEPLGTCPESGKPIFLKIGRFGPYVQRGETDSEEKPQNASLMRGMTSDDVDLETALKLLSLPRNLGDHPDSSEPILAHSGRFGPFVKCGTETRSLDAGTSPLDVTFEQAIALLAQPKKGRRGFGEKREPIKLLAESPVTGEKIQLLEGRYGAYVTDGTTNASLPRDLKAEDLTFDQAVTLLLNRAGRGPSKKKRGTAKKSAAKKAPAKKAPAKKSAAKKSATKKSATADGAAEKSPARKFAAKKSSKKKSPSKATKKASTKSAPKKAVKKVEDISTSES